MSGGLFNAGITRDVPQGWVGQGRHRGEGCVGPGIRASQSSKLSMKGRGREAGQFELYKDHPESKEDQPPHL